MLRRKFLFPVLILSSSLAGCSTPLLQAQIEILHGDPDSPDFYSCSLSGLKGMGSDCGTEYDAMVFTAEILTVAPAPDDESRLTVRPETIFKGTPTLGMEILTVQRRCLPEMKVGDSWLFSLYRGGQSKELLVNYGSRSGPEMAESQQVDLLRRLASLYSAGIVKGHAYSDREATDWDQEEFPSADQPINLTRAEDGRKFKALTDNKGEFEFPPLPAGKYDLDPNTRPGFWTSWSGTIDIEPHRCTAFDLDFHVDGQIAGRLVFPAGVDPSEWEVEATPADDPEVVPASDWTDAAGRFLLHGLSPGRYIVKFEKTERRDGPNLRVDLFAPGTPDRANASVIQLSNATRVGSIDLVVPRSAIE